MSEDYKNGYRDGFKDGMNFNKSQLLPSFTSPSWPGLNEYKCYKCGMIFEANKVYGYVCGNSDCPTKVTAQTNGNTASVIGSSYLSTLTDISKESK